MALKEVALTNMPNIPFVRKALSKYRVKQIDRRMIPVAEAALAEGNEAKKEQLIAEYSRKEHAHAARIEPAIKKILSTSAAYQGKDLDRIARDMRFCWFAYGFLPDEYLTFHLDEKDPQERAAFLSDQQRVRFHCRMNDLSDAFILKDKVLAYQRFRKYFKREAVPVCKPSDYDGFVAFVQKHSRFVAKAALDSFGRGVQLIDLTDRQDKIRSVFEDLLSHGRHLCEDVVVSRPELSVFNPSSVNTMRCFTMNTRQGIKADFCFFRTGRGGSFVDNAGAGGVFADVDENTGVVITDGVDEMGNFYPVHPTSGLRFQGSRIPAWQEMVDTCIEMAESIPTVKFIGWDLAYTEDGWVMIEGNAGAQVGVYQMPTVEGIREKMERYSEIMDLMV